MTAPTNFATDNEPPTIPTERHLLASTSVHAVYLPTTPVRAFYTDPAECSNVHRHRPHPLSFARAPARDRFRKREPSATSVPTPPSHDLARTERERLICLRPHRTRAPRLPHNRAPLPPTSQRPPSVPRPSTPTSPPPPRGTHPVRRRQSLPDRTPPSCKSSFGHIDHHASASAFLHRASRRLARPPRGHTCSIVPVHIHELPRASSSSPLRCTITSIANVCTEHLLPSVSPSTPATSPRLHKSPSASLLRHRASQPVTSPQPPTPRVHRRHIVFLPRPCNCQLLSSARPMPLYGTCPRSPATATSPEC